MLHLTLDTIKHSVSITMMGVPSVGRALAALWSVGGYKVEVTIIFAL